MTKTTGQDLSKACCAVALTWPARRAHLAALAAFAGTGRAPARSELEGIARAESSDPAAVLAELAERDVIAFDGSGEIRAAYPFSPVPTPIKVTWENGPVAYAMCAIDALGMSAMLGHPVCITAAEPRTGRTISVRVNGDQARWSPRRAVVFAGTTARDTCHAADRCCGYISFFTNARAARRWARENPVVTGVILRRAGALRSGIAEFGAFMRLGQAELG